MYRKHVHKVRYDVPKLANDEIVAAGYIPRIWSQFSILSLSSASRRTACRDNVTEPSTVA